jgi:hypothetical protein
MASEAARRRLALGLVALALVGASARAAGAARLARGPGIGFYAVFALWGGVWYAWLAAVSAETRARAKPYLRAGESALSVLAGLGLLVAGATVFEPGAVALAVGGLGLAAVVVGGYRIREILGG